MDTSKVSLSDIPVSIVVSEKDAAIAFNLVGGRRIMPASSTICPPKMVRMS